jgi:glycosyltransferase involved in cell wall biosynthesis
VCSGQSLYQVPQNQDRFSIYYDWAAALDGVMVRGALPQPVLAEEMRRADLWAFPSRVTESACIAMMEAGLSGCRLIACELGAIPETSGGHARLLPLVKHRLGWVESFVDGVTAEIEAIRQDPDTANQKREIARSWFRASCNWDDKAVTWEAYLDQAVVA